MKKNKGFTLIEVLAVLVILSLLITFSVVSVNKIKKKQEVANRINVIRSILTAARAYEADYPNTQDDTSIPGFNVNVDTLLSKGYVDFDQDKYNSYLNKIVSWGNSSTDNLKREICFKENFIQVGKSNTSQYKYKVCDCALETQDVGEKGKVLCKFDSCVNGKCNGWDTNGTTFNNGKSGDEYKVHTLTEDY